MSRLRLSAFCLTSFVLAAPDPGNSEPRFPPAKLDAFKREAIADVDGRAKFTQQMVDQVFSFGELGFQEVETSKYLDRHPREERLQGQARRRRHSDGVDRDVGSGKPVIALGSDIDGIPQASQKPGVAYHDADRRGRAGPWRRTQLRACRSTSPRRSR